MKETPNLCPEKNRDSRKVKSRSEVRQNSGNLKESLPFARYRPGSREETAEALNNKKQKLEGQLDQASRALNRYIEQRENQYPLFFEFVIAASSHYSRWDKLRAARGFKIKLQAGLRYAALKKFCHHHLALKDGRLGDTVDKLLDLKKDMDAIESQIKSHNQVALTFKLSALRVF